MASATDARGLSKSWIDESSIYERLSDSSIGFRGTAGISNDETIGICAIGLSVDFVVGMKHASISIKGVGNIESSRSLGAPFFCGLTCACLDGGV
jgi:hypothetical protein